MCACWSKERRGDCNFSIFHCDRVKAIKSFSLTHPTLLISPFSDLLCHHLPALSSNTSTDFSFLVLNWIHVVRMNLKLGQFQHLPFTFCLNKRKVYDTSLCLRWFVSHPFQHSQWKSISLFVSSGTFHLHSIKLRWQMCRFSYTCVFCSFDRLFVCLSICSPECVSMSMSMSHHYACMHRLSFSFIYGENFVDIFMFWKHKIKMHLFTERTMVIKIIEHTINWKHWWSSV